MAMPCRECGSIKRQRSFCGGCGLYIGPEYEYCNEKGIATNTCMAHFYQGICPTDIQSPPSPSLISSFIHRAKIWWYDLKISISNIFNKGDSNG